MTRSRFEPPARDILTRILISLIVLAGAAASLRLALRPAGAVGAATRTLSEPLNSAGRARVTLDLGAGDLRVGPLGEAAPATLLKATLRAPAGATLERQRSNGGGVAKLDLELLGPATFPNGSGWVFGFGGSSRFHTLSVNLSGRVPLDLSAGLGSGDAELDLAGLRLGQLELKGVSGDVNVTLPGAFDAALKVISGDVNVRVPELDAPSSLTASAVSGDLNVRVPRGAGVRLETRAGLGDLSLPPGFGRSGDGYVRAGAPTLTLRLSTVSGDIRVSEAK